MNDLRVPEIVYLGMTAGQWPLYLCEKDVHAAHWLTEHSDRARRMWRCQLTVIEEVIVVPPSQPRLIAKDDVVEAEILEA